MENEINLHPLRMIRIAKDINMEQMAEYFLVSSAYISAIEKGKRQINIRTLKYGLDNLNITLDDYYELVQFQIDLLEKEMEYTEKYKFMLIKTMSIVSKELKEEFEMLLNTYYCQKVK